MYTKVRQSYGGMHGKLAASPPERGDGLPRLVRRISHRGWSKSSAGLTPNAIAMLTIVSRVGFASPRSISLIRARRVSASSAKSVWDNFEESLNSSTFRHRLS